VSPEQNNRFEIETAGATDVGMKRRLNEDVVVLDTGHDLYVVADGMGGHAAGEVASKIATDEIVRAYETGVAEADETWPEHWASSLSAVANQEMNKNAELKGMGTTVVVAAHPPGEAKLVVCHVGDSRAYRLREGALSLLTRDHSWVHEQVTAGFLTEEAARTHPLKNVVTQALGGSSEPKVEVLETGIDDGDIYLLCSDGLNSMLTDHEIAGFLLEGGSLDEICGNLIEAANQRGGNDNISVVLLRPHRTDAV